MLNEDLIYRAHGMLLDRVNYYNQVAKAHENGSPAMRAAALNRASAYQSAYDILWYAINDNEENIKEFDTYAD